MQILNYKPINKGVLVANFDLKVKKFGDLIIRKCVLFQKGSNRWFSFPTDRVEKDGETKYYPYIYFEDKKLKEAFNDKVMQALAEHGIKEEEPADGGFVPF